MPSPGKVYIQEKTCPSLCTYSNNRVTASYQSWTKRSPWTPWCSSLPPVSDHKPSRAGFISVSVQYVAHQNTGTDTSFSSKSIFKVTELSSLLFLVGRGQQGWWQQHGTGSRCAPRTTVLASPPDHQHPAPLLWHVQGREWSCGHFYLGPDPTSSQ